MTFTGMMSSTAMMENNTTQPPRVASKSPDRTKLTGRAFYESIGSPKLVLAPMVDQSEFAWRLLTRSFMKPEESKNLLAYSPMLHARLFQESQKKYRDNSFQPTRAGLEKMPSPDHQPEQSEWFLDGRPDVDRPLTVQFCANEPNELLEAAKYVQPYCDAVDLNLGCPQGIARKGHYGAFLQEDWDLIYRLINNLHLNLSIPVTAKIRIQETKEKTLEYARMILRAGASILTVHGRQREQKGHKTGLADWSVIRYLRDNLPPETVIFANGNILRYEDMARCLEVTGADGVMSAEGNLHDPTIFAAPPTDSKDRSYWRGRDGKGGYRMDAVFRRYMDIIHKYVLEQEPPKRAPLFHPSHEPTNISEAEAKEEAEEEGMEPPAKRQKKARRDGKMLTTNITAMQPHLFHLLRPLVTVHTEVRDALARSKKGEIQDFENVLRLTEAAVKEGLLDYEQHPEKYEDAEEDANNDKDTAPEDKQEDDGSITDYESSVKAVKACKRPWWVCQPYVRPLPKEALEKGSIQLSRKERAALEEKEQKERTAKQSQRGGSEKGESEREKRDIDAGLDPKEVPAQAMVAG